MFAEENGLVCCFFPDGVIWALGTMVEAAAAATVAVGSGAAPEKMAVSGLASLLRLKGRSVSSLRASSFISLVSYFSVPTFFVNVNVFAFSKAGVNFKRIFLKSKKQSNPMVGGGFLMNLYYIMFPLNPSVTILECLPVQQHKQHLFDI